jgi:hypothetical protein
VGDVVDERVVAARLEERVPVAPRLRAVDEVLALRGVGEDAVDVEDDGRSRGDRAGPPRPVRRRLQLNPPAATSSPAA